jgi:predicted HicB family RNase H-like nuclease
MPRKPARPSITLNIRITPEVHARLVQYLKNSAGMSKGRIVEGALVRLFDSVEQQVAHQLNLVTK